MLEMLCHCTSHPVSKAIHRRTQTHTNSYILTVILGIFFGKTTVNICLRGKLVHDAELFMILQYSSRPPLCNSAKCRSLLLSCLSSTICSIGVKYYNNKYRV